MSHPLRVRRRTTLAFALAALPLAACNWGTRPQHIPAATGPSGARVAIRVRGEPADRVGELYAADSTGVTIAAAGRVVWAAWPRLTGMDVHQFDDRYDVLYDERVTAEKARRIALLSRFPQGLAGEVLARVLAAHGQSEVERLP